MAITIRGIEFQENTNNDMGLEFYNLSHRYGFQCPNWPYFRDVQIERMHYMAKSGVPSSAALADELDGLAAAVQKAHEAAAVTASEEGGVLSALTSQLTKVVKIRKVGEIDWVELLTQSAQKVRGGDLASVVKTLSAGGEGAPDGVAGWLEKANARLALDGAMDKLSKAVLRQLAATGKSG